MSSFESLLEHWIGGGEFVVDDDTEAEAAATAWSFLSFDIGAGYHPPEPAEEQPAPPLVDALQAETDHCASGTAGGSSDGEPGGKQSQTEASSLALSSEGHGGNGVVVPAVEENKDDGEKTRKKKIAFRTRSEVDVLDDGYRWHKYGKKMVKNSPNPRNYYRCSRKGCQVKKLVERARDDERFVITTYDGVHNHSAAPRGYRRLLDPPPHRTASHLIHGTAPHRTVRNLQY